MWDKLKEKLESYISEHYKSIGEFERKNNFKHSAIYDIFRGHSKNPSLSVLIRIANVINCSLDELVGRENLVNYNESSEHKNLSIQGPLLKNISMSLTKFIDQHTLIDAKLSDVLHYIQEIYTYSLESNNGKFDEEFAESFLKKVFNVQ